MAAGYDTIAAFDRATAARPSVHLVVAAPTLGAAGLCDLGSQADTERDGIDMKRGYDLLPDRAADYRK